ncbi:hypothetical protein Tco_0731273 [Tanacetum coccineum]
MDDPNITMEEYIRLEEERAKKHGKVFNWETAKYGKIWYDEDIHNLRSVETKFPAIAFNDGVSSEKKLFCEPMESSFNKEIDFRILFDDPDDEDYTNEFPAIVYNDASMPKSDLLTELTLNPQHIDEFDLKDETSLSEYDDEEQNVLYFNDLFPFNIIQPDDLKSEKDNYDNEVDIIQSSGDADIVNFKTRLARIYRREVHRLQVFDFEGLLELMAEGLSARMLMENRDAQEVILFTSRAWRWLFNIKGPLVHEFILKFFNAFKFGEAMTDLDIAGALQFQLGGTRRRLSWRQFILALISSLGDFLGITPSYTSIRDLILRLYHRLIACSIAGRSKAPEKVTVTDLFYLRGMDVGSINVPYLLARYLRLFAAGRKRGALISGGQFVARLAKHFGLLPEERLQGLTIDDTWAWVVLGPKRHPNAAAGTPGVAQDAPVVDEGGQVDPTPVQVPPPPPTSAKTMPQRMARLEEDVHEIRGALAEQRKVIGAMAKDFSRFTV